MGAMGSSSFPSFTWGRFLILAKFHFARITGFPGEVGSKTASASAFPSATWERGRDWLQRLLAHGIEFFIHVIPGLLSFDRGFGQPGLGFLLGLLSGREDVERADELTKFDHSATDVDEVFLP